MRKLYKLWLIAAMATLAACTPRTTNYYFDPVNGDDNNNGKSIDAPFRTLAKLQEISPQGGDSVLLRSGATFNEQLYLSCRGCEQKPVVLGKYGGQQRPYVRGDGSNVAAVHIFNSDNIVIRDLEISNGAQMPISGLKGLWIELNDMGEAYNTTVDNLYIHDVLGSNVISDGGGFGICVQNARDQDTTSSRFVGMNIENCLIENCQRDGIKFRGHWIRSKWNPNLKVVIRNNVLTGVPGDGIVPVGCDGALVEYNVMKECPKTLPPSEACDGIWPWASDNTVVQFNVVSDHKSIVDAYAYDSDWGCRNSLFQYNLSYNNDGGFMLVIGTDGWPEDWCVNGNLNTVIRYNVSVNDGLRNYTTDNGYGYFSPVIHMTGFTQNTLMEKNIFYVTPKKAPYIDKTILHFTRHDRMYGQGDTFRNNYIYASEPTVAAKQEESKNNLFADNIYVGPLGTPSEGFSRHGGGFDKTLWYDQRDENWDTLVGFLKDKTIPVDGEQVKVLDLIGFN